MDTLEHGIDARGVARLTLNRPMQHNALNRQMIDELSATLSDLAGRCRLLVLCAKGRSFCAGADIAWMRASVSLSADENRADAMALSDLLQRLNTFPAPTVARIQGPAIGGGVGLISCCDMAIAADSAHFSLAEVRLGLTPATISPYVVAAIGARQARRYFISAESFDAITACQVGLVHRVTPGDSLDSHLTDWIQAALEGAPSAQLAARQLVQDVAGRDVDDTLRENLAGRLATTRAGAEAQEGLAAFIDRRKPDWSQA